MNNRIIWNIANVMARCFPFIAVGCLGWSIIDPNLELTTSKIHLAITGLFALPTWFIQIGVINEP